MSGPLSELPPLPEHPTVSVVIPARDAEDTLEAAVASALDQSVLLDITIAAADGPTREVAERLARDDRRIRVVDNPVGTAPAGLNAAIAASQGQVVVRLDAHAALGPHYIAKAIEVLRETGAANVGGRQIPVAEGGVARAIAAAMASPLGSGGARYRVGGPPGDVETVYLGVFRREALDHVGGFDETLVRNQDYMLNHRLREAGGRVYFHPDLGVRYRPRPTLVGLARQYAGYGAWKRYVLRRHPDSLHPRQLAAPLLVLGLLGGVALSLLAGLWQPLALLAGLYLATVAVGAVAAVTGARGRSRVPTDAAGLHLAPAVVVALTTMHVAWGLGFLIGRSGGPRRASSATMGPHAVDG